MIVFVVAVGMVLPLTAAIRFDDPRALPAVPLAAGTIAVAAVALRARTPARRYGRMLLAVLLLALMSAVIILAKQPWWPISP